ncbi:hypothetical protein TM49_20375 [Martelella endophytica]|uniref:DUF2125 domain-containing protein n=1 Tax=Martelella endophytica TaxID=1486262 RepID=A0A0D5LVT1_MAREN|nr:hypothetical protein TM49_20375 [Martelella endophytica]
MVVIVAILYGLAWFFIARTVKSRIFTLLEGQGDRDVVVACEDVGYQGFPADFGFSCDGVHIRDRRTDTTFDTPRLLAKAPVYSPWTVLATIEGPATVANDEGVILRAEFGHLGGKLIYGSSAPRLVTYDLSDLVLRFSDATGRQGTLTTEKAQGLARNTDGDLDVALSVSNAILRPQNAGEALEPVSLNLLATVDDAGPLLGKRIRPQMLRGKSGILNQAVVVVGESNSNLALSGPFSFDQDGYLDGRFSFELTGIDAVSGALQLALPQAADLVATVTGLVKAFTSGQRTLSLDVRVAHGRATMGLIPLGQIPPI